MPYNSIISRTDAAALIPEDVSNRLLQGIVNESAVLDMFTRVTMSTNQQRMPVLAALPTAYFVNGDSGLKQTTEVNWDNKYLDAEELAAIVPIPEAVLDDTDFDVWGNIRPLLEQAIARAFDAAVFFGSNAPASWPTDVAAAAAAAGNSVARGTNSTGANGGIAADISDLFETLEADGFDANGVVAHTRWKGLTRNARDADGVRLSEISPDDWYGVGVMYPMRGLWPAAATGNAEAFVMERNNFIAAVRQDFTYKLLDQAVITDNTGAIIYNLAQQDMVALRIVFRGAWQVANLINYDQTTEADRYPAGVMTHP